MATLSKIKPGQVLYDVKINSGLAAFRDKYSVWGVLVEEVNIEEGYIVARWNIVNAPQKMFEHRIKKLRVKEPKQ